MPGVSRTQRAEVKYNVTLDFPHLGLHSAASSGNLGLVTYALDHGQPVNSVLDGVLPLHVASSGGNDLIVRLLIERGADVNAPRLPRKYSSDRHRDTSAPIVGSSGSTPLHFAAANGHEHVVLTLLLHGAHPNRADKHGITPEMVARQNGWTRCAELLGQWSHEKDRDLRERETLTPAVPEPEGTSKLDSFEGKVHEKRVKVKCSIDSAINMLRPTLPTPPLSGQIQTDVSYTPSPPPTGAASFDLSTSASAAQGFPSRRPSLPHIFDSAPHTAAHIHSQSQGSSYHLSKSSGRPSFSSSRRPRSAGTDAESPASGSAASTPGRLRGKLSLLHMFKKSAGSEPAGGATPESRDSLSGSGYASSSSALTSASASPAPERERERSRGPSAHSPLKTRTSESGLLSTASGSGSSHPSVLTTIPSSRSRLGSENHTVPANGSQYPPLAVELHRKLSMERHRSRSGSGSSSNPTETKSQSPSPQPVPLSQSQSQPQAHSHKSPPVRPSILRPHGRSSPSGQSTFQLPTQLGEGSVRSLRFDSNSTAASVSNKRSGLNLDLKSNGSIGSLRGENHSGAGSPRSPWSASSQQRLRERDMSVETRLRNRECTIVDVDDEDDDEEGYGEVISPRIGLGLGLTDSKSRLNEIKSAERQLHRRPSTNSQLSHESFPTSPLPSPTVAPESGFDCPFSINRPPLHPLLGDTIQPPQSQIHLPRSSESRANLLAIQGPAIDGRGRGDSFGSMSTSTDASLPLTPGPGSGGLGLQIRSPDAASFDLPPVEGEVEIEDKDKVSRRTRTDSSTSRLNYLVERDRQHSRARTMSPPRSRGLPLDIDIRAISSHAQAEALVQRAQKSILEMENVDIELPVLGLVGGTNAPTLGTNGGALANGRTPLSAKLAAYGESLAIERRFKEKEERQREKVRGIVRESEWEGDSGRSPSSVRSNETTIGSPMTPSQSRGGGQLRSRGSGSSFRKFSLDERPGQSLTSSQRRKKPKRPHTSDGDTSDHTSGFLSPVSQQVSPGHKSSLSGSLLHSHSSPSPDAFLRPPTSARTLPIPSSHDQPPRIIRSRTPDPGNSYLDLPLSVSPSGGTFGVPLSRVSTAPPRHASPDIVTQRSLSEQERERARANKLMKMGLLAHDSFPRSRSPYGHGRNGSGSGTLSGKHRFGGFRGFVQTLTGKT